VIKVFLLDDHEVVRRGLRELLEREGDIEVVGESGTAREASRRIPALRPDVAILDGRLPDGSGIDVCRDVRAVDSSIKGLILTSYEDDEALFAAIMAGAAGYVLKQIRGTDLIDAVRRVAAGQSLLDPAVTQRVLERIRHGVEVPRELKALTEQERRILEYVAEGLTNREIAFEDVPGREDGEELRVEPAGQARPRTPHPSRRAGHPPPWRPPPLGSPTAAHPGAGYRCFTCGGQVAVHGAAGTSKAMSSQARRWRTA
jgi:two-component system response regulator DevR